jgi:hypothetical protein
MPDFRQSEHARRHHRDAKATALRTLSRSRPSAGFGTRRLASSMRDIAQRLGDEINAKSISGVLEPVDDHFDNGPRIVPVGFSGR